MEVGFSEKKSSPPLPPSLQDWTYNAYKIFDPANKNGTIDIPREFTSTSSYAASLAHKTNHSFLPNAEFVAYEHPRFGLVPCLVSTHDVEAGEEVFVHYGYELNGCPEWYEEAWLKGRYTQVQISDFRKKKSVFGKIWQEIFRFRTP